MVQAAPQPFKFQEVFNLTTKGLDPANFKMGLTTFESQKYICVKEGAVSISGLCTAISAQKTLQNIFQILITFFLDIIASRNC